MGGRAKLGHDNCCNGPSGYVITYGSWYKCSAQVNDIGTVYSRVEGLSKGDGMVGFAWNARREAVFGGSADRPTVRLSLLRNDMPPHHALV